MRWMTAARLKTLRRPGRYRADPTLFLFIKDTGSRSWVQRLTIDGVRREIGLGGYPSVGLADAREQAAENRRLARKGGNPLARPRQAPTFQRAAKMTHEANRARLSERASARWLATLARYAFPLIGDRRVDRIEQADVLRVLTPIWTSKPPTARKVRAAVRATFAWCRAHGHVKHNPAGEAIDGALPVMPAVKTHFRALDYRDVPAALEHIAGSTASLPVRACLRFVALTAVRSSEARLAKWPEIDLDAGTWTIPAARMKTGIEHRVPLASAAVETLESVRGLHSPAGVIVYETGNAEAQRRASTDERLTAERLSAEEKMRMLPGPETMAMVVAQQGAEKTLKAILIARGARRIEGHHIHKMAEQLERHGEALPAGIDKKDLEMLAEANMGGRFPDHDWDGYEPDYDKFFDIANRIHRWGCKRVPEILHSAGRR